MYFDIFQYSNQEVNKHVIISEQGVVKLNVVLKNQISGVKYYQYITKEITTIF